MYHNQVVKEFPNLRADMEVTNAGFLFTELDVARTFLDLAATTQDRETVRRNCQHARLAYDTILKFLPRVLLAEEDRAEIETRLALLKRRLGGAD